MKLQAFHTALGEDSQIYSETEEVDNFGLFERSPEEEERDAQEREPHEKRSAGEMMKIGVPVALAGRKKRAGEPSGRFLPVLPGPDKKAAGMA